MRKTIVLVVFAIAWGVFAQDVRKHLITVANGPASTGSVLSQRYTAARGIGEGRTTTDAEYSKSYCFSLDWNCGLANSVACYAFGYKVGDKDDGTLGYKDVKLDSNGNGTDSTTNNYEYRDSTRDSFFYRWIADKIPEEAKLNAAFSTISPERMSSATPAIMLELPHEEEPEGGYALIRIEAVFSKEWLPTDNMGDINVDGIPDCYVSYYKFDVLDEQGAVVGNDLSRLDVYNGDDDYLPFVYGTLTSPLVFSPTYNRYMPADSAFTAKLEIRGYGGGLNNAPILAGVATVPAERMYTDPDLDSNSTLSKVEYLAWCDFTNANPTATINDWSPERPTDPTNPDTDWDGMPDGYEYYMWYRAHVGYMDGEEHKYLTGRKYNLANPSCPTVITSTRIAELFDPITTAAFDWEVHDTDGDGISDTMEFVLGTNPVDYDTDGDGLSDGYEMFWLKTDPLLYATSGVEKDSDQISVSDVSCECDGLKHSIRVLGDTVLTNYLVYSTSPLGPFLLKKPTYVEPGTYTNWCYVATQSANGPVHFAVVHISEKMVRAPGLCGMPVPEKWILQYPSLVACSDNDLATALMKQTGKRDGESNMLCVWQDYVAGTNPTNEDDVFKASITKDKNGKIIISYTPEFKDENEKAKRKYTTLGKKSLMDATEWEVVPEGREADYNFFKVTVEMNP